MSRELENFKQKRSLDQYKVKIHYISNMRSRSQKLNNNK